MPLPSLAADSGDHGESDGADRRRPDHRDRPPSPGPLRKTLPTPLPTPTPTPTSFPALPADSAQGSRPNKVDLPMEDDMSFRPPVTAYQPSRPRYLIDRVKNEWRNKARFGPDGSWPGDHSDEWICEIMIRPSRWKRSVVVVLTVLTFCCISYVRWVRPWWSERSALNHSLRLDSHAPGYGWYGVNVRPQFSDMTQVGALSEKLLPTTHPEPIEGSPKGRRLIFVGDVHGCKTERATTPAKGGPPIVSMLTRRTVVKLLEEVAFSPDTDHLVFTGDLIAKGPDPTGVIDLVDSLGASCVRGNHEDRVLLAYRDLNSQHVPIVDNAHPPEHVLARSLTSEQARYLGECPVILKVGNLSGMGDVIVVHGGIVPGIALEDQDPVHVMTMRSIDLDTHVPSDSKAGTPWTKLWNHFQKHQATDARSTVIYGHDASRGLTIKKYTKGLDSGCVRGGKLTALVIDGGAKKLSEKVVSVKCKDYRTHHGSRRQVQSREPE